MASFTRLYRDARSPRYLSFKYTSWNFIGIVIDRHTGVLISPYPEPTEETIERSLRSLLPRRPGLMDNFLNCS